MFEKITTHLGELEKDAGNYPAAINWFRAAQKVSLTPGAIQNIIDGIQKTMAAQTNAPAAAH